jgi:dTMP kinase
VKRGRLIVFEGIDGCGKSTQLARLATSLRADGHDLVTTGEPSDGPVGQRIREMARSGQALDPEEELRWFVEDRRAHVAEVVEPALAAGRPVLCDRYFLSTVAYLGARGLDWRQILADSEAEFPIPDRVVLLEIEAERAVERIRTRGAPIEGVFERRDFLERVAEVFRRIERDYLVRVDARAGLDPVERSILALELMG